MFTPYPKTPRLFRDVIITEKIDGTNAGIRVTEDGQVYAQSRKRLITQGNDNFGFANWVADNHDDLALVLGPGMHFGEWWGKGIQRQYGMQEKVFSLFNTSRWENVEFLLPSLRVVPVLYQGPFDTENVRFWVDELCYVGSVASPGYPLPEGIVIYHTAANMVFKALIDNDDIPKGLAA